MTAIKHLESLGACRQAMEWVRSRPPNCQTLPALWRDCPRADWMLWLAGRQPQPDLAGIVAAAHACADIARDWADAADAVDAADAADADAATAYYYAASAAAAADAADAAAYYYAASAAAAADAADAASAADAADAADAYYAASAARESAHADCAWLVRLLVRAPVMP